MRLPDVIGPLTQSVHLFNPPERMFSARSPKLAEPIVEATRTGIRLDWDLEPAFGRSTGVWDDPEYDLKHYRIERILMDAGSVKAAVPPRRVTVKAAAPMRLVRDLDTGEFVWRFLRPNAQYVDDLSDLTENLRAAILPGAGKTTETVTSVRYIVVPVDTAGTEGAPTPLQLDVAPRRPLRDGVRRAALHFEYRDANGEIRSIDAPAARPAVTLGLDDGMDPPAPKGSCRRTVPSSPANGAMSCGCARSVPSRPVSMAATRSPMRWRGLRPAILPRSSSPTRISS